jgi:hypothetical protein
VVKDSTSGGYVDRMTHNFFQYWVTIWDKELNLVSLKLGFDELIEVLHSKDKEHYDYHRAVRTRSRHLKMLKDHLGIEYKKAKKEKEKEPLILRLNSYRNLLDKLEVERAIVHDKTIDDGWTRYKKHDVQYTQLTPEKETLMNEYNEKLEAFKTFQKEMFTAIFSK